MKQLGIMVLLAIAIVSGADAQETKAVLLKEPAGWAFERFALPPVFAPSFPFHGAEELRFSPGMFDKNSHQYFTYAFVAQLDGRNSMSVQEIQLYLNNYFKGLCSTTAKDRKLVIDTSGITISVKENTAAKSNRYDALLHVFGVFADGAPVVLNMEIKIMPDKNADKTYLVFIASPQPVTDPVWTELRSIQNQFSIPEAQKTK